MLNRTLCDVLSEMRACYKTRNFASIMGLIEEAQSMGNSMESGLADVKDFKWLKGEIKRLKKLRKEKQVEAGEETSRWD